MKCARCDDKAVAWVYTEYLCSHHSVEALGEKELEEYRTVADDMEIIRPDEELEK